MDAPHPPQHVGPAATHLAAAEEAGDGITPQQLWRAVRKSLWLIGSLTVVATLGATFYVLGTPKVYRATATIQIDPNPPLPLGREVKGAVSVGTGDYWANREYYETQYRIIKSRRIAEETVRALGLQHDAGYGAPDGSKSGGAGIEVTAQRLRAKLAVEGVDDSRLVEVSLEDTDPARAQRILSALIETYIQRNLDDVLASAGNAGDWLRTQLTKLKEELESSELELHKYKKDKQILSVSIDDQSNMLREELTQLNQELTRARTLFEEVDSRYQQLAKINSKDPTDLPARELLDSSVLQSLRGEYLSGKKDYDSLLAGGKGTDHPATKAAAAHVSASREALLAEVRNIRGALANSRAALTKQIEGLSGLSENAKQRALDLNLLEIEYKRLERSKLNTEKLYSLVLERSKESDLTQLMRFNNITVVDAPLRPAAPIRPNVPATIAIGLIAGLVFGVAAALGRELLDRTIKTPEHIERDLKLAFLGLLPQSIAAPSRYATRGRRRRREAGGTVPAPDSPPELIAHVAPSSGLAEAARSIRSNLLFMSPDRPHRRLLVTSAGPSEGKTTVATSIAITLAQTGKRVLMVDCDLRRPRLHKIFRRNNDIGVTTAIIEPQILDGASLDTDVPNLSVLPAGPHVPNPAELLSSERFARLLELLESRYDRIVIDSPPLVPVTDAAILSTVVHGCVLVVRSFVTTKDMAKHAARALRDVGAPILGVVLNAVDLTRREDGYYQYYYYKRDGYGYGEREQPTGTAA